MSNAGRAEGEVGKTAQLYFYDWEPNVIGPSGKPALNEPTVTGGANAGAAQFGLPEYQAVLRAAKRAPILRKNDTTWQRGCTPTQANGCIYGSWYLLDTKHEKVLCKQATADLPAGGNRSRAVRRRLQAAAGLTVKAVRVNPGTVLVQARPVESAAGKVPEPQPQQLVRAQRRPGARRAATSPTPSRASTKGPAKAASPT